MNIPPATPNKNRALSNPLRARRIVPSRTPPGSQLYQKVLSKIPDRTWEKVFSFARGKQNISKWRRNRGRLPLHLVRCLDPQDLKSFRRVYKAMAPTRKLAKSLLKQINAVNVQVCQALQETIAANWVDRGGQL
jgi:hypothetical protein